jgi:hypothetical protein
MNKQNINGFLRERGVKKTWKTPLAPDAIDHDNEDGDDDGNKDDGNDDDGNEDDGNDDDGNGDDGAGASGGNGTNDTDRINPNLNDRNTGNTNLTQTPINKKLLQSSV